MTERLPIKLAKDVCDKYNLMQVIVLCMDSGGTHHFITYGKDKKNCEEAGLSADRLKEQLDWPEETVSNYSNDSIDIPF